MLGENEITVPQSQIELYLDHMMMYSVEIKKYAEHSKVKFLIDISKLIDEYIKLAAFSVSAESSRGGLTLHKQFEAYRVGHAEKIAELIHGLFSEFLKDDVTYRCFIETLGNLREDKGQSNA